MIKAILFDKDGTLLDFDKTWGVWLQGFLNDLATDAAHAADMGAAIGFDIASITFDPNSPAIAGTPEDQADILLPFLPEWDAAGLLEHGNASAANAPPVPVLPLEPFLAELRPTYRLGIATNDSVAAGTAHMQVLNVANSFDAILGFDSVTNPKPAPDMLLQFADQLQLHPSEVAMVGDSLHDLHAGQAAGMVCVGVLTGLAPSAVLAPAADVVLDSVAQLSGWLDARPS